MSTETAAPEGRAADLATENAALRTALQYTLDAIKTGRSEPLFIARDLIENTLADFKIPS